MTKENPRIHVIREKVREWLNERLSEGHQGKAGPEVEQNVREYWPQLFTNSNESAKGEPPTVTNRHALIIAEEFLDWAVHFTQEHEDDVNSVKIQAKLCGLDVETYEKRNRERFISHRNLKYFMRSSDILGGFTQSIMTLAGEEKLSLAEAERHIANIKYGQRIIENAMEAIQGNVPGSMIADDPMHNTILEALDFAAINFEYSGIKSAISGRGRGRGNAGGNE